MSEISTLLYSAWRSLILTRFLSYQPVSKIRVEGLVSKFSPGGGRAGTDRQFFFINGRPCAPAKVQKAINEVYRTFNANQSPFIVADFVLPTGVYLGHPFICFVMGVTFFRFV
jgi:DNA mismatch repair ATPase MutL